MGFSEEWKMKNLRPMLARVISKISENHSWKLWGENQGDFCCVFVVGYFQVS